MSSRGAHVVKSTTRLQSDAVQAASVRSSPRSDRVASDSLPSSAGSCLRVRRTHSERRQSWRPSTPWSGPSRTSQRTASAWSRGATSPIAEVCSCAAASGVADGDFGDGHGIDVSLVGFLSRVDVGLVAGLQFGLQG